MLVSLWTVLGFVCGSLPFSVWLGRLIIRKDIRYYGDGNPGAINAWRVGGWRAGVPAILLDFLKGAVPVGLAEPLAGVSGWGLLPIALSPVIGHAFSPFLGFRGGKSVAATFGIWSGLTLWEGPTMLGCFLGLFFLIQKIDAWSVMLAMLLLAAYLCVRQPDETHVFVIWFGNMMVLALQHRRELRNVPRPRAWLLRSFKG
jgi:glycerol-3-phosphate acyltransferase PlsY